MNILVSYRGIPKAPGWATGDYLVKAFRDLGHTCTPYGRYYSKEPGELAGQPMAAVPYEIDLIVFLECNDADPQYGELAMLDCPKVLWDFDTAMHPAGTVDLIRYLQPDHVFLANPLWVDRVPGSKYLPYAVDPERFKPGTVERKGAAMIGSPFPERVEFCKAANIELISGVYGEDYLRALQGLKVHVHNHDSGGEGLLVLRIWETMASGAVLIAPESESMRRHFVPFTDFIPYDRDEMVGGISDFDIMRHDNIRLDMAHDAREEILAHHTYQHRARAILAAL
jgi:hypothetical protein